MRNRTMEINIKGTLEKGFGRVENFDTEKGGLYVETTEDIRGWMLGDKTRKIYTIPDLYVKVLTDLSIAIIPKDSDGNEVTVVVLNPRDLARMLLCKNDDVGSSIEYARIEPPKYAELTAKIGNHICIEPLFRGSWIRIQVFPGSDIFEMIDNDESEVLELLESGRKETKEVLADLVGRYYDMDSDIRVALAKMPRYGNSCNCEEPLVFKQIFEGKFEEILQTCLNCGGTVER